MLFQKKTLYAKAAVRNSISYSIDGGEPFYLNLIPRFVFVYFEDFFQMPIFTLAGWPIGFTKFEINLIQNIEYCVNFRKKYSTEFVLNVRRSKVPMLSFFR